MSNLYYLLAAQPSKIHIWNCSLKKSFSKIDFSKNINFMFLIYSSAASWEFSESSDELSKTSVICLTTFLSIYLHFLQKTFIFFASRIQANSS